MEKGGELNKELKEEINLTLTTLLREIGNSRQQLFNKVLNFHTEIHKELSKNKIDAERQKEIQNEVSRTVKMAHQQLPHLKMNMPKPTAAPKPTPTPKATATPKPAAAPKPAPPVAKSKPKPAAKKKK